MEEAGDRSVALLPKQEKKQDDDSALTRKVWVESKKLWTIVGPAIFSRLVTYSMNIITQAFAGHLGDLELASISIANTVVVGFNFGLLLGMASALETLCGQAFGAKQYHMLGVYMQRSWIVLFVWGVLLLPMYFFATSILELTGQTAELSAQAGMVSIWFIPLHFSFVLLLPMYFFATPILELTGQTAELSAQAGMVSIWFIPLHFSFVFLFPLTRFLQCQLKNSVIAAVSAAALVVHIFVTWLFVSKLKFGIIGIALTLDFSWWVTVFGLYGYACCGGCPLTWKGFSMEAFVGLWEFVKLSTASGVMLCLENWYYRILLILAGNVKNAEVAVDALSICMGINGWEMMIPLAFFAGTGVRVANELGAGNGKGARFATIVSVVTSTVIGLFFCFLIMGFHDKFALIFTTSPIVLDAVDDLSILLAFTILLNSVQPILSGVAVGSGWQATVAYVNIGTYYLIGVPVGIIIGWIFNYGVLGIWSGMIGGTAVQTLILAYMTIRCDWDKEALKAGTKMDEWATPQ